MVAGLLAPDAGAVTLLGRAAFREGTGADPAAYREARRGIGYVFQDPEDQIITTVVEDDVAFGPENLGLPREEIAARVERELRRVALTDLAKADPTRLSGGQQQRVAIAGALALHPELLVLDEPGALLDVRGRRGVMRACAKLHARGTAIVHVTHFVEEAEAADRVLVMDRGRVALEGTPAEVFARADALEELHLELPAARRLVLALGREAAPEPAPSAGGRRDAARAVRGDAAAVEAAGVSFSYGAAPVLDDVSLEVAAGEFVCVVGQTGSGKSTLARLACALAQPDAGTLATCGVDVRDRRRRRELRRRVGYAMQRPERQLFCDTVAEDVAFGPRNRGLPEVEVSRLVAETLRLLGIEDLADRSPFGLSGGQQRLAGLAGVLVGDPDLLVLDEPMAGLDPTGRQGLRRILRGLHAEGRALLMVTHSMEDAAELADRIVVLDRGRVVAQGTPAEVFADARDLASRGLGVPGPLELAHALEAAGAGPLGGPLTLDALAGALRARGVGPARLEELLGEVA